MGANAVLLKQKNKIEQINRSILLFQLTASVELDWL